MPWIMQMLWFTLLFIGVAVALWVSFWLLLVLFSLGVMAVMWARLRNFLLNKGIINPSPGVPLTDADDVTESDTTIITTLIEGDFTRVDDEENR